MLTIDYGDDNDYVYDAIFFEDEPGLPQKRSIETAEEIGRKRKNIVGLDDLHVEDFGDRIIILI